MSPLLSLSFYGNKDLWQLIELSDHKFDRGILSLSYPFTATEDVKSAMGPYCRRYKCTVFFSFLVCPLSLFEKPWIILSQQKTRDGPESSSSKLFCTTTGYQTSSCMFSFPCIRVVHGLGFSLRIQNETT